MGLFVGIIAFAVGFALTLVIGLDRAGSAECDGVCVEQIPWIMLVACFVGTVCGVAAGLYARAYVKAGRGGHTDEVE